MEFAATFVLIMTFTNTTNQHSGAITAVEFNTKERCVATGEAWINQVQKNNPRSNFSYLCAKK